MDLLPISGATLASEPTVLASVRTIGAQYGVDYTDDRAVAEMFGERREALRWSQRGRRAWFGGLALAVGAVWPFIGPEVPAFTGSPALAYGPAVPFLAVGIGLLISVRARWKRELEHPALVGYRHVLGVARSRGLPVTHVPAWLEGRSEYGGTKPAVPVPTYRPVAPDTPDTTSTPSTPAGPYGDRPQDVPPMPPAVAEYEEIADQGGWHDEAGCLFVIAALIGAAYGWWQGVALGYLALLLVPLAVRVWLAGSRQGKEKERLRTEALDYVEAIARAQASGAAVPELSPRLRKLLDEEQWLGRR
ncbi:hypothetical protein IAG44_16665 [Streptomyces roseirectus]|uniref:Uncharacterized protein n=1 Tax=Streptomyces roseirectus TaxID=2768066 RepID=A0A7H0IDN9_9ACTN|nr:hypothetical protein [Streptomyces roseirectus]QNP70905.1 hypothetical protein IAG44_16665 [Streptomyces roseirectus]